MPNGLENILINSKAYQSLSSRHQSNIMLSNINQFHCGPVTGIILAGHKTVRSRAIDMALSVDGGPDITRGVHFNDPIVFVICCQLVSKGGIEQPDQSIV